MNANSGFRIYKRSLVNKFLEEEWIFKELIASELTLRAILSGHQIKEVPVSYNQRKNESRGLPLKKIPSVIFSVLLNFPKLRKAIFRPRQEIDEAT